MSTIALLPPINGNPASARYAHCATATGAFWKVGLELAGASRPAQAKRSELYGTSDLEPMSFAHGYEFGNNPAAHKKLHNDVHACTSK